MHAFIRSLKNLYGLLPIIHMKTCTLVQHTHTHTHTCSAEFLRLSHTHSLSPCLPPPFPRTSHKLQERHSTETVSERILLPVNPHRRLLCLHHRLHHCVVRSCLLTNLNDDFGTQEREEKLYYGRFMSKRHHQTKETRQERQRERESSKMKRDQDQDENVTTAAG